MPQEQSLAGVIAAALAHKGVRRLFGIPGGGSSLDLIAACDSAGIEFVLTRSEIAAAIMAAVSGELTGVPGVVLTGIGPGAASAVNGIAYASLERAPVVLFSDGPAASPHQAFDQQALYAPITKWRGRLRPATGAADFARALSACLASPQGPVYCEMTAGDAAATLSDPSIPAIDGKAGEAIDGADLIRVRALLENCRKPVLLAGLETRSGNAPAALKQLAEALACPVLMTYKAKGVLSHDHPLNAGLVTGARGEAACLEGADLVLCYGLDPIELIPGPWRLPVPVIEVRAAAEPRLAIDPACRLVGPLSEMAQDLLPLSKSGWSSREVAALRASLLGRVALAGEGRTAADAIQALAAAAPKGCRLTVDAGAHMFSTLALWPAEEPFGVLKSNGLSTMGYALPAAIASTLQEPARPVLAVTGDGGMMMSLAELATAVERDLPVVVAVVNDAALSLIAIKQQRQQRPSRGVATRPVDFAATARGLGCRAWRVEPRDAIEPVLAAAFDGKGPAVIDVVADPSGYGDQLERLRG